MLLAFSKSVRMRPSFLYQPEPGKLITGSAATCVKLGNLGHIIVTLPCASYSSHVSSVYTKSVTILLSCLQLLSAILQRLRDPEDFLAAALTSKRMRQVVSETSLRVRPNYKQKLSDSPPFLMHSSKLLPGTNLYCHYLYLPFWDA